MQGLPINVTATLNPFCKYSAVCVLGHILLSLIARETCHIIEICSLVL